MSEIDITVPNIGEFKDVEVIEVLVSEGQTVVKNDPLITIESDKSSIEIPSNFHGKIKSLNIKVGDKVSEGSLILILENNINNLEPSKKEIKIENRPKSFETTKLQTDQIRVRSSNANDILPASPKARKFARELGVDIIKLRVVKKMEE